DRGVDRKVGLAAKAARRKRRRRHEAIAHASRLPLVRGRNAGEDAILDERHLTRSNRAEDGAPRYRQAAAAGAAPGSDSGARIRAGVDDAVGDSDVSRLVDLERS